MPILNLEAMSSVAIQQLVATGTLPDFPPIDQLHEPTSDNRPDENASDNCWAVAGVACVDYLTGASYNGDQLHDYVYGEGYRGGGDLWAPRSLEWINQRGCDLEPARWASDANVGAILAYVRESIDAMRPCVMTWPSQWGIQDRNSATGYHAVDCIGYDATSYYYMNPWGGIFQAYSAQWTASRCVNAGAMKRTGPMIPTGWTDNGTVLTAPNGVPVTQGFRQWVLSHPWTGDNWPIAPEYHAAHIEEGPGRDQSAGQCMDFKFTRLGWYAARGVFQCWLGWDYHQFRFDNASCADPISAAPGAPVLSINGQVTASDTATIKAVTR